MLARTLRRYLKNPADAEDATQATFVRAYERISTFRGEAPFRSWLLRIAVNVALNRLRVTALGEPLELADDVAFANSLGTTHLVATQLWQRIGEQIGALPPKQRLAVELRLFHELTFEEIAVLMGSTEDTAKMNYHHGIKRLRGLLPR